MFDSIRRGFGFLGQAIDMARKDSDLLKPSFYAMGVGLVVSIIGSMPIIAVAVLGGDTDLARFILFVLGTLLIFAQYTVAYIFSGMTVYLIYGYLAEGDGRMEEAWHIVQRDALDIMSLAAASTAVKLVETQLRKGRARNAGGAIFASILERVWTTATYFVLPAMVIEDLNLPQALKRATYMIKNNLLLVAVTEIGVSGVVGLVSFLLIIFAVLLGVGLFAALAQVAPIVGIGLAVLIAGTLITLVTVFASYVTTAYHTCLFIWARAAEKAVNAGQAAQTAVAPAPLAAILNPAA